MFASASEVYYKCINTINCTGQNTSKDLLLALGEADANMYLCSEELRPSENKFPSLLLLHYESVLVRIVQGTNSPRTVRERSN